MDSQPQNALSIPQFVFGTSCLGNIYKAETYSNKKEIVEACLSNANGIAFFDTAGKYGAGLALEVLGNCLNDLKTPHTKVIISNKLGWLRTELYGDEPTFEPGVWKDLEYDAVQRISYDGILECFEQGNQLLNGYNSDFVSVHDPDEYLSTAQDSSDYKKRYADILEAYRALMELKKSKKVKAVGIGAKDWKVIRMISKDIDLDWVMIANSLTLLSHPAELIVFIEELDKKNIPIINSAIFNGGFLIGSEFYNYRQLDANSQADQILLDWRARFFEVCKQYDVLPAVACYHYSKNFKGIKSIALSTTKAEKVAQNLDMANQTIPEAFWLTMKEKGLI